MPTPERVKENFFSKIYTNGLSFARGLRERVGLFLGGEAMVQARIRDAQDEVVRRYSATISHELNQPLAVIIGYEEIIRLRNDRLSRKDIEAMIGQIGESATDLADKVEKFTKLTGYQGRHFAGADLIDIHTPQTEEGSL